MLNKKAQEFLTGRLFKFLVIAFILAVVLFGVWRWGIPDKIKTIFPNFFPQNNSEISELSLACPTNVSIISDTNPKYISFCADESCRNKRATKLYIENNLIYLDIGWATDPEIGRIQRGNVLINAGILKGVGTQAQPELYFEIKDSLPSYEDLLNLHLSYFYTQYKLCRDARTNELETRREVLQTIREISVEGKTFYYDLDELIRNKGTKTTPLYFDKKLTSLAKSFIAVSGIEIQRDKEGEENIQSHVVGNKALIPLSEQTYNVQITDQRNKVEGQRAEVALLDENTGQDFTVDNSYNKLGVYTNGDKLTHAAYWKKNGRIYFQLLDYANENYYSDWILMEYWDAYQTFARVPAWAKM